MLDFSRLENIRQWVNLPLVLMARQGYRLRIFSKPSNWGYANQRCNGAEKCLLAGVKKLPAEHPEATDPRDYLQSAKSAMAMW